MYSLILYCTIVGGNPDSPLLIVDEIRAGAEGIQNKVVSATNTLSRTREVSNS